MMLSLECVLTLPGFSYGLLPDYSLDLKVGFFLKSKHVTNLFIWALP